MFMTTIHRFSSQQAPSYLFHGMKPAVSLDTRLKCPMIQYIETPWLMMPRIVDRCCVISEHTMRAIQFSFVHGNPKVRGGRLAFGIVKVRYSPSVVPNSIAFGILQVNTVIQKMISRRRKYNVPSLNKIDRLRAYEIFSEFDSAKYGAVSRRRILAKLEKCLQTRN